MDDNRDTGAANGPLKEQRIVLALVAVAGAAALVALAGWLFDISAASRLGFAGPPIWPLVAIDELLLSLGFAATVLRHRVAPYLLISSLIISATAFIERLFGLSLGIDTLFFAGEIARIGAQYPGRPSPDSIMAPGLIAAALLLTSRRNHIGAELASLLATASLCFALFSLALIMSMPSAPSMIGQIYASPVPVALVSILLAIAFLMWRQEAGWAALFRGDRPRQPMLGLTLPLIILLPTLPAFIALWGRDAAFTTPLGAAMLAVACNILVVGLLVWLSVRRRFFNQAALREVMSALDVAAITLTRTDGEITYWSGGCEALYGWTASEAVGRNKYELLHSRNDDGGSGDLFPVSPMERELLEQRRDGTEISVLERSQMLDRSPREPLFVLKMLDISDRVRAEAALRESETRLSIAADAQQLGVSHWDIATGRLEWSPGSEQRLGIEPGSLASFEQWERQVDPEDVRGVMDSVARAAANHDDRMSFKYRLRQANGITRVIEGSARCLYDEKGEIGAIIAANVDITERLDREAVIRAGEAQLRSVLEAAPAAMVVVNQAAVILEFSPSAEHLWGYAAADVLGRPSSLLAAPEERERLRTAIGRDPDDVEAVARHGVSAMALTSDGRRVPIEVSIGRARTSAGTLVTLFCHDVSDRLAAEQRLSELNAELAHISRQSAMSEVAADLAHELNQPLSATANFLAAARMLIERGESGARVIDHLQMAEDQTLRSGEIIRRLRDFLAKREVEMRPESLGHVVHEAVDLVLFGSAQFDISLTYELDPAADSIFVDRIQVQQVLVNLLRNAIEVLRSLPDTKREILIASKPVADDMIEVSVSDSGPGLPKELGEQLYSRFATTKTGTAMGIGLSISRRIIEAHGGALVAENRRAGGATFRFTLPALGEAEE